MRIAAALLLSLLLLMQPGGAFAAKVDDDAKYKQQAVYLYNYISYVEWPQIIYEGETKKVSLCIIGRDTLGEHIDKVAQKAAELGQLKIDIRRNVGIDSAEECNIVYISRSEADNYPLYLSHLGNSAVLTVSEIENFAKKGGGIEFVVRQGKQGFVVNNRQAKAQKLKIRPELLEISTEVLE